MKSETNLAKKARLESSEARPKSTKTNKKLKKTTQWKASHPNSTKTSKIDKTQKNKIKT